MHDIVLGETIMAVEYRTDLEYFERLDGVDYPKVSPRTTHARVQFAVARHLWDQGRRFGKVGSEWKFSAIRWSTRCFRGWRSTCAKFSPI